MMKNEITASRLKTALSDKNMSQQELSDKTGIGKASISQYVNGSHKPSNISAAKMAKILNVNPLWLMGFTVESETDSKAENVNNELLEIYGKLNDKGKERLIEYAAELAKIYPADK